MSKHETKKSDKGYLLILFCVFLTLSALLIANSYRLNPFAIYAKPEGTNAAHNIDLFWHIRLHKPYRMQQVQAKNMVFGSSRAGRLPPQLMTEDGQSTYNASLPGGTLHEIHRQMEHAQEVQSLDSVILGLDYSMFRDDRPRSLPGFADDRLLRRSPSGLERLKHTWQAFEDRWRTLYSRSAVVASIESFEDRSDSSRVFFPDGTWRAEPGDRAGRWVYSMLARQKYFEFTEPSHQLDFRKFDQILAFCESEGIELALLLSPTHAYQMNAIQLAGGWPRYLRYQRDVLDRVELAQERGLNVRLLGFESKPPILFEAISPDYRWYLDGIHFTTEAGGEIMRCVGNRSDCRPEFQPLELNSANVDGYLNQVDALMQEYQTVRAGDYAKLEKQISNLREGGHRK